jgi:hypothetical protein
VAAGSDDGSSGTLSSHPATAAAVPADPPPQTRGQRVHQLQAEQLGYPALLLASATMPAATSRSLTLLDWDIRTRKLNARSESSL